MIDVAKLKYDMSLIGEFIKSLKHEARRPCHNPSIEEIETLLHHKSVATKLYVLRASLKNKHHLRNKSCAWHDAIVQELTPKYACH